MDELDNNMDMDDLYIDQSQQFFDKKKNKEVINLNSFTLLKLIGKGSYAKVVLVRKKDNNKIYALKILKKNYIKMRK